MHYCLNVRNIILFMSTLENNIKLVISFLHSNIGVDRAETSEYVLF